MLTRTALLVSALAMPAAAGFMTDSDAVQEPVEASLTTTAPLAETIPNERLYFTEVDVDALMRAMVIDSQDQVVGTVAELMVSRTGRITDAVVRLSGGPLGVSGERIVVGFDQLTVRDRGAEGLQTYVLHAAQEKAALKERPRFQG